MSKFKQLAHPLFERFDFVPNRYTLAEIAQRVALMRGVPYDEVYRALCDLMNDRPSR